MQEPGGYGEPNDRAIGAAQRGQQRRIAGRGDRTVVAHGPVGGWEAADLPEPEVVHDPTSQVGSPT